MSDNNLNAMGILDIRMFGNFDILYNGKSVFPKGKHINKIFEILKYMIVNNEKELSPEIICEQIWPETEYMDPRNTVTTYIFRLNKFLKEGNDIGIDISEHLKIVCQKGSYKLTISEKSLLDIKRFNNLYEQIEVEKNDDNKEDLILEAIALYKGELLSDSGSDSWIVPYKNYYRRVYSELSRSILAMYAEKNQYKEILKISKAIFEVYPLDEHANLYYLKSLFELNYINEAITHYEYISSRFISELGVQPNREMREIYHGMKNKRSSNVIGDAPGVPNYNQLFKEDSEFWKIFSNAIDDYMDKNAETKSYSIGYAVINNSAQDQMDNAVELLGSAIQTVLRKEDCYTFFEPNVFVFVLNDVPEDYFELIKERIQKDFKQNYKKGISIDIKINPSYSYIRHKTLQ